MKLFSRDSLREVLHTLQQNPLRTFLTGCGMFWGLFMLVLMTGVGNGFARSLTAEMDGFRGGATNVVTIEGGRTSRPFGGMRRGRQIRLTAADAEAIGREIPGVSLATARLSTDLAGAELEVKRDDKSDRSLPIVGDSWAFHRFEGVSLRAGRFLTPIDLEQRRTVAVIGEVARATLFDVGEDPIGSIVWIHDRAFTVVGVFASNFARQRGQWFNKQIYIPATTYAAAFTDGVAVDMVAVLGQPGRSADQIEARVKSLLRARHAIHPDDRRALVATNREREMKRMQQLFDSINVFVWVIGLVTLAAGAMGVTNIVTITVVERTKEFGIRKAIGARPRAIIAQVVLESTLLTSVAGYLGLFSGVALLEAGSRLLRKLPAERQPIFLMEPGIDLKTALVAGATLTLVGALAGLSPAAKAVAIRPVEALAHE